MKTFNEYYNENVYTTKWMNMVFSLTHRLKFARPVHKRQSCKIQLPCIDPYLLICQKTLTNGNKIMMHLEIFNVFAYKSKFPSNTKSYLVFVGRINAE